VVSTAGHTEFGRIAVGLGERPPETAFQAGLRRFSVLLLEVAVVLTVAICTGRLPLPRRRARSRGHQLQRRMSRFSYPGPRHHRDIHA
jgi:hypothetical protein